MVIGVDNAAGKGFEVSDRRKPLFPVSLLVRAAYVGKTNCKALIAHISAADFHDKSRQVGVSVTVHQSKSGTISRIRVSDHIGVEHTNHIHTCVTIAPRNSTTPDQTLLFTGVKLQFECVLEADPGFADNARKFCPNVLTVLTLPQPLTNITVSRTISYLHSTKNLKK